jgi:hypothetical protein
VNVSSHLAVQVMNGNRPQLLGPRRNRVAEFERVRTREGFFEEEETIAVERQEGDATVVDLAAPCWQTGEAFTSTMKLSRLSHWRTLYDINCRQILSP